MRVSGSSCNTITKFNIRHEERSGAVNVALTDFGSDHSFDEAAAIFARHYHFKISDSTVRRITENMGTIGEKFIENKLAEYEKAEKEDLLLLAPLENVFLGFDGCSIRTGVLEKIETIEPSWEEKNDPLSRTEVPALARPDLRAGITPSGRVKCKRVESWRDIRLGYAKQSSAKESKKWFVGGMKSFPDLMKELFCLSLGLGMDENTKPVATSDGGNGLYEALDETFCDLQFILDCFHFKEHLFETAKDLGYKEGDEKRWVSSRLELAWKGRIDTLIRELKKEYVKTKSEKTRLLIGYIKRFSKCIFYGSYEEQGFPVGSGEIESAHKYITQKRLKLAGACWKPENINPMLALRIIKANDWWGEFSTHCHDLVA